MKTRTLPPELLTIFILGSIYLILLTVTFLLRKVFGLGRFSFFDKMLPKLPKKPKFSPLLFIILFPSILWGLSKHILQILRKTLFGEKTFTHKIVKKTPPSKITSQSDPKQLSLGSRIGGLLGSFFLIIGVHYLLSFFLQNHLPPVRIYSIDSIIIFILLYQFFGK